MLENDPIYVHFKKGWEVEEGKLWKKKKNNFPLASLPPKLCFEGSF
jgi:hypothetical protein